MNQRHAHATIVLVHGAWHGAWCWNPVLPALDEAGAPHIEIDLPLTGHRDDVRAVVDSLDATPGRKVLVGHSYGGLVISGAAQHRGDVDHLVYVCAFLLDEGARVLDNLGDLPPTRLLDALTRTPDGRSAVRPDGAMAAFYNTSPIGLATDAAARLRPMDPGSTSHPCTGAPWQAIETTYVICEQDQAIPPEAQRIMSTGRADRIVSLQTDHSPFLSTPAELADIVLACR
jgi:pimeloyl-ACP methyl ester carboxylesterase